MIPSSTFYTAVVENIYDPKFLGRVQIRVVGLHTNDKELIPTSDLPWALPVSPNEPSMSGMGKTPLGYLQGSWVVVYPVNDTLQEFFVFGSIPGHPTVQPDTEKGFCDPDAEYPLYLEESDVNVNARPEDPKYLPALYRAERLAGTDFEIDEPLQDYGAEYPHNHVIEGPGGILIELDHTPDAERVHVRHPTGTFIEIFPDGRMVTKVVEDAWTIYEGNLNVHVMGNRKTIIDGNDDILIKGNSKISVDGTISEESAGHTMKFK